MSHARQEQMSKMDASADWVCLNCSNLNYSFRKVCNRCRSITRQQNHQNYLQMQFLQSYYQPFHQEEPIHLEPTPPVLHHLEPTPPVLQTLYNQSGNVDAGISFTKEPFRSQQDLSQIKNTESCNESGFMFLLQNAWEGLYVCEDVSQFKVEQGEQTREEQGECECEDILFNFDLTFI